MPRRSLALVLGLLLARPARATVAVVSTLAGRPDVQPSPLPPFADGAGTNALFEQPSGVAVTADGATLLVADKANNRQIGQITAALWSPTCKRNIALARIDAPFFDSKDSFWVDMYLQRELQWERRNVRAWIVERPFYDPARRRATPPLER